jgi:hypothetical protein
MDFIDVAAKYHALFLKRFWNQEDRSGWLTAEWLNVWDSLSPRINTPPPPHIRVIPRNLEYLRIYFHERAYMETQRQAETGWAFKRRVYDTLRTMSTLETKPRVVRIMQLQPAIDWSRVWGQSPQRNIA